MQPPPHAPITAFDTGQTGITPQMLAGCPPADEILARLDNLLGPAQPTLLVAHHAPVEADVLYAYRAWAGLVASVSPSILIRIDQYAAVQPGCLPGADRNLMNPA